MIKLKELLSPLLSEGGNAFGNVIKIEQKYVPATLAAVDSKLLKQLGLIGLNTDAFLLGSALKKAEPSGDLDIGISTDQIAAANGIKLSDVLTFVNKTAKGLGYNTKPMPGFEQVSVEFPISGAKGTVQIDLMLSNNLDFTRFIYHSPDFTKGESKYKGVYRNILLSAVVETPSMEVLKTQDNMPVLIQKSVLRFTQGIVNVRKSYEGHNGTILKNPKLLKQYDSLISNTPEEIIHTFLGKQYSVDDIDTYEKLMNIVKNKKFNGDKMRSAIIDKFKMGIENSSLPLPEDLK